MPDRVHGGRCNNAVGLRLLRWKECDMDELLILFC